MIQLDQMLTEPDTAWKILTTYGSEHTPTATCNSSCTYCYNCSESLNHLCSNATSLPGCHEGLSSILCHQTFPFCSPYPQWPYFNAICRACKA